MNAEQTPARPQAGTSARVVCAGDSITRGVSSGDYVAMLRARFRSGPFEFVNAGRNGDTSGDLLRRLGAVVASRPDVVTILIGSNDVENAMVKRPPEDDGATLATYGANLGAIVSRLAAETSARIALLSIPMLGEDLASPANRGVARLNAAIREVASAHGLSYLPLHERLCAVLEHSPGARRAFPVPRRVAASSLLRHYLLGEGWDRISARHGFVLFTDGVHLNDTGAALVAEVVGEALPSLAADQVE